MDTEKELEMEGGIPQLYELGYHIVPTVSEDALRDEVSKIREAVESLEGVVVTDVTPELRELEYPLVKEVSNKRTHHTSAYFGWMTFMLSPQSAPVLKEKLDTFPTLLRFLIMKTSEEVVSEKSSKKMAFLGGEGRDKKHTERGGMISDSELDKTIDELVTE